jgi:predicted ATPase
MAYPDADVFHCSDAGLKRVHYEDTEHFQIMHDFVTNPRRMLDILLSE